MTASQAGYKAITDDGGPAKEGTEKQMQARYARHGARRGLRLA